MAKRTAGSFSAMPARADRGPFKRKTADRVRAETLPSFRAERKFSRTMETTLRRERIGDFARGSSLLRPREAPLRFVGRRPPRFQASSGDAARGRLFTTSVVMALWLSRLGKRSH